MKFNTTKTKGGYKILSLHGPDCFGWFAGVVEHNEELVGLTWNKTGNCFPDSVDADYDLIPLADESKSDHTAVTDKLQYALDMCMDKLHDLDQRLALEMKRNDELYKDAVARINGLRADYLADQSTVQPSRVDGIEERLQALESASKYLTDEQYTHCNQLEDHHERLAALEQRSQPTDKGVWVTTKTFWDACWSQVSVKGEPLEDLFERMAKQLGLEE